MKTAKCYPLMVIAFFCLTSFGQNVFNVSDPIVTYNPGAPIGSVSNPKAPTDSRMVKWVRTIADPNLINWNVNQFKCYYGANLAFRLRFPNNFNPANASRYPIVVFFHGGGESRPVTDNELHLFWGAQLLEQLMNEGKWNGFILFSQVQTVEWYSPQLVSTNNIVDSLVKYANVDGNKAISIGLSSGGNAAIAYSQMFPKRVATCVTSSPSFVRGLSGSIPQMLQIPTWIGVAGSDYNPTPYDVISFTNSFRNAGGNIYQSYFNAADRVIWDVQWRQKTTAGNYLLLDYLNGISKAQPVVYFKNSTFCNSQAINAKMGITAGFSAYEWQVDNGGGFSNIAGANANEYTATSVGKYRVRFRPVSGANWSDWSPRPIDIISRNCPSDTAFVESFEKTNPFYYAEAAYKPVTIECQNGIATEAGYTITQDASGTIGRRFLLHTTAANANCKYTGADQVWRTTSPAAVTPNTNYELSFSVANQYDVNGARIVPRINFSNLTGIAAFVNGDGIWKRFTYSWNSGAATVADIDLINQTGLSSGNDFAIDEVVLIRKGVIVNTCPLPSGIITTDIGGVALPGSACFTAPANYQVKGSGNDIWGNSDGFRYVYKSFNGDGTIEVKVSSQDATNVWNKAGVMIRESLADNSKHAFMALTSGNGAAFQYRTTTGGASGNLSRGGLKAPYYARLQRQGNTFTGFVSADGISWSQVGTTTVAMNAGVYAGLAVTSHDNGLLSLASFDQWKINNLAVQTAAPGTVLGETITAIPAGEHKMIALRVFPNPAPKQFTVDFTIENRQNIVLRIMGADGRVYFTESLSNFSGQYRKDFGKLNLKKGIYAITLVTGEGSKTFVLAKE
jgi:pimeloyl-ACP methyl ester carboxylesterase